jgi:hypothetical protein
MLENDINGKERGKEIKGEKKRKKRKATTNRIIKLAYYRLYYRLSITVLLQLKVGFKSSSEMVKILRLGPI